VPGAEVALSACRSVVGTVAAMVIRAVRLAAIHNQPRSWSSDRTNVVLKGLL